MLEVRPNCENCNRPFPNGNAKAWICTFECTFRQDCVENNLHNVCPNCGGGFERRPTRPSDLVRKYPSSQDSVLKPINQIEIKKLLMQYRGTNPNER
jgi:hypothetical protein